jgi:hypothetical protein
VPPGIGFNPSSFQTATPPSAEGFVEDNGDDPTTSVTETKFDALLDVILDILVDIPVESFEL